MAILVKNADYLITMDKKRRVLRRASLYLEGHKIKEVDSKRKRADRIIDASGMIVMPGLINCHHHLFQSLFRNLPYLQNQRIDRWLAAMTVISHEITPVASYWSSLTAMAELLLSGCTTTADFFYISLENEEEVLKAIMRAAEKIGVRLHLYQEKEAMIEKYHQPKRFSMFRLGLEICTPLSKPKEDFKKMLHLARKYKVNLQIHLSESEFENNYCQKKFGKRPMAYLQSLGWKGPNVSYVHCLYLNQREFGVLSRSKTSVVHCPISNARGEKIAPITEMLERGIKVGIGVDGSAGNDSGNMLEEMRWARTLQGAREGFTYLKPSQVLEMGTVGGAKVLNRDDVGSLEEGKAADIAIFNPKNKIGHAGAVCDPVGSLIASQAIPAEYVIVNGKMVVEKGDLQTIELQEIIDRQNKIAQEIIKRAEEKTGWPLSKIQWIKAITD